MHFSKTYSQLLLTLPNELRDNAIEYRRLKKLINELVAELQSLGLTPVVLQELLQRDPGAKARIIPDHVSPAQGKGKEPAWGGRPSKTDSYSQNLFSVPLPPSSPALRPKVVYELAGEGSSGDIIPRLRLWIERSAFLPSPLPKNIKQRLQDFSDDYTNDSTRSPSPTLTTEPSDNTPSMDASPPQELEVSCATLLQDDIILSSPVESRPGHDLLWSLQNQASLKTSDTWSVVANTSDTTHATVIDSTLSAASDPENNHEVVIPLASDTAFFRLLIDALNSLSIALATSQTEFVASTKALSDVISRTSRPASARGKSDLYTWRAIFQLYMEAQVFESTSERDRGERSVEDSEARLSQFAHRVGEGGFFLKLNASRNGLQHFLELNIRLMNLKKFQIANAEAARKILKKHAKRTALPLPNTAIDVIPALELGQATAAFPHILVVTLTETLMPIVPHIDDYICSICMAIAFKPIRLNCGHLFCVRCLVKMQKRAQDDCPMCRAPTVIAANKSNVDRALINFMLDWFPKETKEKAKSNEYEAAKEEMDELGLDTRCTIM